MSIEVTPQEIDAYRLRKEIERRARLGRQWAEQLKGEARGATDDASTRAAARPRRRSKYG